MPKKTREQKMLERERQRQLDAASDRMKMYLQRMWAEQDSAVKEQRQAAAPAA